MRFDLLKHVPSVDDLGRWARGIKSASVTVLAAGAALLTSVGVFNAVTSNAVSVEQIKVPPPFQEKGFSSEIATARLLDEIATYERQSPSAKDRVSILGRNQQDELQRLQITEVGGLDIQRIEALLQDALGIQRQSISGDITYRTDGDAIIYHVRLRRQPGNQILLDLTTMGEPEAVLRKAALAMIEVLDPHIAASIHWRANDEESALRLIDVVLNNDRADDDKYSLNLLGYIHLAHKRYDAANAVFEQIMATDPHFSPAHAMASWIHLDKREFEAALTEADRAIEYGPNKWWGYFAKARAFREMKNGDAAAEYFQKTISLRPDSPGPYIQAGGFFAAQGKPGEAEKALRQGLMLYPDSAILHASLGDALARQQQHDRAEKEYQKALALDAANLTALVGLYELNAARGNKNALLELRPKLEAAIDGRVQIDTRLRERIRAALSQG
jgi:tetratricopeptide (TPR) repeat protein